MFTLQGKYAAATVYAEIIDDAAVSQIMLILNQPFTKGQKICIMPDAHPGKGCIIGTTMTIGDKIPPSLVGIDIGCGMLAVKLRQKTINWQQLDDTIRDFIPTGENIAESPRPEIKKCRTEELICGKTWSRRTEGKALGTLGGGNHFIEVDKDSNGNLWLVIHTGSRRLGVKVATYYQKAATKTLHSISAEQTNALRKQLLQEHRILEFNTELKKLHPVFESIPDESCWCEGQLLENYLHDMQIVQQYADMNRRVIADIILHKMNLDATDMFTTVHNYIDTKTHILRKGAVSAQKGERILIPINMKDGALLCTGKGNPAWNQSAPHGSGRLLSRSQAKQELSMETYQKEMTGIWTSSVCESTLNEAPMAYKPIEAITNTIRETAQIDDIIKPLYNYKAH